VSIFNDYKDQLIFGPYIRGASHRRWDEIQHQRRCLLRAAGISDRLAIANDFAKRYKYPVPFGVDDMNNAANDAYAAWPERLYIIDENGKIAYRGGNGPFKYYPSEVRAWLASRYGEVKHPEAKPAEPKVAETKPAEKKS
jgi:hypothetical protein